MLSLFKKRTQNQHLVIRVMQDLYWVFCLALFVLLELWLYRRVHYREPVKGDGLGELVFNSQAFILYTVVIFLLTLVFSSTGYAVLVFLAGIGRRLIAWMQKYAWYSSRRLWIIGVMVIVVVFGIFITLLWNNDKESPVVPLGRSKTSLGTYLSSFDSPLRIYAFDTTFFGVDANGKHMTLNRLPAYIPDSDVFFDAFQDKVYSYRDGSLEVFDITTQSTSEVSIPLETLSFEGLELVAVHNGTVLFRPQASFASRTQFIYFDSEQGVFVDKYIVDIAARKYAQIYNIAHDGEMYALYFTAHEGRRTSPFPWARRVGGSKEVLSVYLLHEDNPLYAAGVGQAWAQRHASATGFSKLVKGSLGFIPFSKSFFGFDDISFIDALEPLLIIPTQRPGNLEALYRETFRLRNLYALHNGTIAQELDDGLLQIDIRNRTATYVRGDSAINDIVSDAFLLASSIEGHFSHVNESSCAADTSLGSTSRSMRNAIGTFVFCLE